jgi:putative intracellular protease/amidase
MVEIAHIALLLSCHGPALFPGVIDATTGKSIISGKTITGFTTEGEYVMHLMDTLKSWGEPMVEEIAAALGAKCMLRN